MQKLQATLKASILIKSDDSQRRFLAQHSFAIMLEQCCNYSKQCRNNVSLRSKRFQSSYCANVRAGAKKKKVERGGGGVPSFPSPSPVIPFFFCSCSSFLDEPREETLATQATTANTGIEQKCLLTKNTQIYTPTPHPHPHVYDTIYYALQGGYNFWVLINEVL